MCNRLLWILFLSGVLLWPLSVGSQTPTVPSDEFSSGGASRGCACVEERQACYQLQNVLDAESRGQKHNPNCFDLTNRAMEVERQMCELDEKYNHRQPKTWEEEIAEYREYHQNYRTLLQQRTDLLDQAQKECQIPQSSVPVIAQASPNPTSRLKGGASVTNVTGNMNKNKFPDEKGHTGPGDSIPFPYPYFGSQEIIVTVNGDHGDGELIEGNVKKGPNPDQTKWFYRYAKGIVHRDPEDRNKDTFEIQELTDLNGNKYDAQHPIPVPNPPYPSYPFPIIIHPHPTGP